ncbi:hypothetical protein AJ79_05270 [Helicocarpus griseus UAMH5409]|uniref:tRNA (uracil-O(2)-)-methyltransferase n=1 Tax=Helicocarpus griseus UAMH5409 TaxID=1447875 RepID=A0A2B7XQL7_9EURO|nr:hypothetical protein AJ79_05270 [Helicocarpus griseus UAMH5409]
MSSTIPRSRESPTAQPDMAFAATLERSCLSSSLQTWVTSPELMKTGEKFPIEAFLGVTNHLLANPNINSSHVFRADILYDSSGILKTVDDKESNCCGNSENTNSEQSIIVSPKAISPESIPGFRLTRTVVRRFIPRKEIDRPIEQSCYFYEDSDKGDVPNGARKERQRCLFVCAPHAVSENELPYYHPPVRALAQLYDFTRASASASDGDGSGTLSIHFLPFSPEFPQFIPYRLQRTLLALLSTQLRLSRKPFAATGPFKPNTAAPKDNIIPQNIVQNTYSRLKQAYAADLMNNWVETTEPSKHVFEDLSIAAFLIELWKTMYSLPTSAKRDNTNGTKDHPPPFPGFVDIACGNGVLTYILHAEGYDGWGFDARRRKSWSIFPNSTQDRLKEAICIPKPFKDLFEHSQDPGSQTQETELHAGIFSKDTFIISNHADELTLWTPLLGVLSNPDNPLPFLAIPCCSHALSGTRYRFPAPKSSSKNPSNSTVPVESSQSDPGGNKNNGTADTQPAQQSPETQETESPEQNAPPSTGDLKALRALKLDERTNPENQSSAYASLTAKVMQVADEVGYGSDIDKTLLRIPSTRNIGIVGGVKRAMVMKDGEKTEGAEGLGTNGTRNENRNGMNRVEEVVERECARYGGVEAAAKMWIERSLGLQKTQGRGKVKGGGGHGH